MRAILQVGEGGAVGIVVEVVGGLLGNDGQKLIMGERFVSIIVYSINQSHQLNEAYSVCFSCFWSIRLFI